MVNTDCHQPVAQQAARTGTLPESLAKSLFNRPGTGTRFGRAGASHPGPLAGAKIVGGSETLESYPAGSGLPSIFSRDDRG